MCMRDDEWCDATEVCMKILELWETDCSSAHGMKSKDEKEWVDDKWVVVVEFGLRD